MPLIIIRYFAIDYAAAFATPLSLMPPYHAAAAMMLMLLRPIDGAYATLRRRTPCLIRHFRRASAMLLRATLCYGCATLLLIIVLPRYADILFRYAHADAMMLPLR